MKYAISKNGCIMAAAVFKYYIGILYVGMYMYKMKGGSTFLQLVLCTAEMAVKLFVFTFYFTLEQSCCTSS